MPVALPGPAGVRLIFWTLLGVTMLGGGGVGDGGVNGGGVTDVPSTELVITVAVTVNPGGMLVVNEPNLMVMGTSANGTMGNETVEYAMEIRDGWMMVDNEWVVDEGAQGIKREMNQITIVL